MNRHHHYQNVNSYWYDEVPDHWKKTKNKYVFHQDKKIVGSSWEDHVLLTMGKSGVKPRDMEGGGKFPASFENYQVVTPNQIIFCLFDLDETPRTVGKSSDFGMITSAYDVFSTTTENDPQFWTYFYQMIDDHKGLRPYYTGLRKVVRSETFMGIEVFSPPMEEQKLISRYLDKKTAQIGSLVEKIQKKIDLLKEQRSSLINHYVTKGLDSNFEMKDSGVEWIGHIPKHWKTISLRYCVEILRGKFSHRPRNDPDYYNGEYPFVQTGDISRSGKYLTEYFQTLSKKGFAVSKEFPSETLVMSITGAKMGSVSILKFKSCFPDSIVGFKPTNAWSVDFLYYLFLSLESELFRISIVSTQPNINIDRIGDIRIPLVPLPEQKRISSILDDVEERYDKLIKLHLRKIYLLNEQKQSLISSVVTGKVRVTEDMI